MAATAERLVVLCKTANISELPSILADCATRDIDAEKSLRRRSVVSPMTAEKANVISVKMDTQLRVEGGKGAEL